MNLSCALLIMYQSQGYTVKTMKNQFLIYQKITAKPKPRNLGGQGRKL